MPLSTRRLIHHNYMRRLGKHPGIIIDQQEAINTALSVNFTEMIDGSWLKRREEYKALWTNQPKPELNVAADNRLPALYKIDELIAIISPRLVLQRQPGGRGL